MECYTFSELAGAFASLACAWFGSAYFAACPGQIEGFELPDTRSRRVGSRCTCHASYDVSFRLFFRRIRTALSDWVVS